MRNVPERRLYNIIRLKQKNPFDCAHRIPIYTQNNIESLQ